MFLGFAERFTTEVQRLIPSAVVVAPAERKYSTWTGGSTLSVTVAGQRQWVSKEDYDELGPSCCHSFRAYGEV